MYVGKGTSLTINEKKVGKLTKIGSPKVDTDEIEVTNMDSGSWKEYMMGFSDGGEVSLEGYLQGDDAGQAELVKLVDSKEIADAEIVFPGGSAPKWTFSAYVKSFETSAEHNGAVGFTASLRVSGKPTLSMSAAG